MKIGVLSDTHIPKNALELPGAIYKEFAHVDMILHAGDLSEMSVLTSLEEIAPVQAVQGNMDSSELKALLPKKRIVKAGNFKIGLIHGYGPPNGLMKHLKQEFKGGVDAVVFGHSHTPMNQTLDGILYFNPGSATDKIFATHNTYGIIEAGKTLTGRIIKI